MYAHINFPGGRVAIQRTADGASIPADPDNVDYDAYLAWVAAGGTPSEVSAGQLVPQVVPMWKAKSVLDDAGLIGPFNAVVATQAAAVRYAWEYATECHRNSASLIAIWHAAGKTDAELDALFTAADAISI